MDSNHELMTNISSIIQQYVDDQLKSSKSRIVQLNSELENVKVLYSHSLSSNVNGKIMNEEYYKRYQNTLSALSTAYSIIQLYRTKLAQCIDLFKQYNIPYSNIIIDNNFLQLEQSLVNSLNDSFQYETSPTHQTTNTMGSSELTHLREEDKSLQTSQMVSYSHEEVQKTQTPVHLSQHEKHIESHLLDEPSHYTTENQLIQGTLDTVHLETQNPSTDLVLDHHIGSYSGGQSIDSMNMIEAPDYTPMYPQVSSNRRVSNSSSNYQILLNKNQPQNPMDSILQANIIDNLKESNHIISNDPFIGEKQKPQHENTIYYKGTPSSTDSKIDYPYEFSVSPSKSTSLTPIMDSFTPLSNNTSKRVLNGDQLLNKKHSPHFTINGND